MRLFTSKTRRGEPPLVARRETKSENEGTESAQGEMSFRKYSRLPARALYKQKTERKSGRREGKPRWSRDGGGGQRTRREATRGTRERRYPSTGAKERESPAERKNVRKCLSLRLDVPGAIVVIPSRQSRNPSL